MSDNVVRHTYRELNDKEKYQIKSIKDAGEIFIMLCNEIGKSRELSLAVTNVEQAIMWAVKHVTR